MTENDWKGANFKQEEDHSVETKELLNRINAETLPVLLRSTNKTVDEFVDDLLVLEKVCRLSGDIPSTEKLAVEALRLYRTQNEIDKMLNMLDILMKKRAQTNQVQSAMIAESAVVLRDGTLTKEHEENVLERLAHVTENKIHVELEHARFTIELASRHKNRGMKRSAADMLRSLQIETITNMPRLEKLTALNQQIKLCLELEDYEHTPLVSRKINHRALARSEATEQKLIYFTLMREYYTIRKSYFNVARCWYETFLTESDVNKRQTAMSNMVLYYLIAEHASAKEIEDLAECTAFSPQTKFADRVTALVGLEERLKSDLEEVPSLHVILHRFNSIELIREKIAAEISEICATHPELVEYPARQEVLRDRSSEHDLIVISRFYTRIPIVRLAELVGLSPEHTESFIMTMVGNKMLYAKMDRVDGLVVFELRKNTTEVIASWNEAVERSVSLLDKASHLITKERMLQNLPVTRVN